MEYSFEEQLVDWHSELLKKEWAALFTATYVYKEREGFIPGNLNNVILFLYINKCSEKSSDFSAL